MYAPKILQFLVFMWLMGETTGIVDGQIAELQTIAVLTMMFEGLELIAWMGLMHIFGPN